MNRTLLALPALLIVLVTVTAAFAAPPMEPFVLEDDSVLIEAEPDHGGITRIVDKASGINLAPPQGMAESFRLLLVKPDMSTVAVLGKDQRLTGARVGEGEMTLTWGGPLRDTSGTEHKITVRLTAQIVKGGLDFGFHLDNNGEFKVQEARYPIIGGLSGFGAPGKDPDGIIWAPTSNPWQKLAQLPFGKDALGYPGQMIMSFLSIQSKAANRTLYLASHDEIARYKVFHLDEKETPAGKDIFACIQHSPFTPPGKSFDGSTIALRFTDGDWKAAGRLYREWFGRTFGIAQPSEDGNWIRRQSFFLMTMFMLPEGTITIRFRDIPKWARAAKECGINAVQVSGWQMGGHDNGYPYYIPDPRLGTMKELEDGIRECHKMGVKVFFFVNYQPAMVESNWYKNELSKMREMTADGGHTWMAGWGMGTLWARMGHPKLMTWIDLAFPQYRKIIVDQFEALAKIGADGVHVDKMFPTAIQYNPDSPLSPDTATWEGAILLTKEIMAACRKHNPVWAMSFECNWDRMLQFGGATWWVGNQLITRSIFPENVETLGLYQSYDYLGVNNLVRGGHAVMVAPMNFCRPTDWAPFRDLGMYIKEVKRIRDQLQEVVFFGEVLGREGVKLRGELAQGVEYNVFRGRQSGKRVCILTNSSSEPRTQVIEGFEGKPGGAARIHIPGRKAEIVSLPAAIEVPAERLAFVEETSAKPSVARAKLPIQSPSTPNPQPSTIPNGAFETNTFDGWIADPNWKIMDNGLAWYSGWQGKYWAWSGGTGEAAMGKLRSKPFVLDKPCVRMLISGWNSVHGTGNPRRWNYVTLNLEDGTEIDRVWAPNVTVFVPAFLDGSKHVGKRVYIEAVDDADQPTFSMLCIDDVRTADLPADYARPVDPLPAFDPKKSIRLEDHSILIEVSRVNGSVTRIHDKVAKLDLILEPRLAGSYRFALPIPGKEPWQTLEANWIFGRDQKLSSHSIDGGKLTLRWDAPLRNYLGAKYYASVTETIDLKDGGALFTLTIDNRTPYQVGEVYFPVIGGIKGLGHTNGVLKATEMARPASGDSAATAGIFRVFNNMSAFGDQGPEQFFAYPDTQPEPWLAFQSAKIGRSVYIGAHGPTDRKQVIRLELVPASSGTPRDDGNWPRPEELKVEPAAAHLPREGLPCGVELSFVEFANHPARKVYEAAPVFIRFSEGDWKEARKAYTAR